MQLYVKYDINDIVTLKAVFGPDLRQEYRLHILDIETVTCIAGTQVFYIGRLFFNDAGRSQFLDRKWKMREDELGEKVEVNA